MARIARVVAEGMPHHITQRGNRRQKTFFSNEDYAAYIDLMAQWCRKYAVDIWAYCLMPNHLIAVPGKKENLRLAVGEAHRQYTRRVNFREGWPGVYPVYREQPCSRKTGFTAGAMALEQRCRPHNRSK
jgi:putative transposase